MSENILINKQMSLLWQNGINKSAFPRFHQTYRLQQFGESKRNCFLITLTAINVLRKHELSSYAVMITF